MKTRLTTADANDRLADGNTAPGCGRAVTGGSTLERLLTMKSGFYVIVPSGETVDIEAPEASNLRIWRSLLHRIVIMRRAAHCVASPRVYDLLTCPPVSVIILFNA